MNGQKISLKERAKNLPYGYGCYLMKNADGKIIYVGKAKNLRNRVSSYFNNSAKSPKTQIMISHIVDFNFQLAQTEAEAFILESNLIKKHTPKYNILMRDDKSYPYVVIDKREDFPRLEYKRRALRHRDIKVYGPFVTGSNIVEVIRILTRSFALRDCGLREFLSRKEPCILHQMHQCTAPCVGKIDRNQYMRDLQLALVFFEGGADESLAILEQRMRDHAEKEEFEQALLLRDYREILRDFIRVSKQENAEIKERWDVDVAAYYAGKIEVDIALYIVRKGILIGQKNFHFPTVDSREDLQEEVQACLLQYYQNTHDSLPQILITPFEKEKIFFLNQVFEEIDSLKSIKIKPPGRKFKSLLELACGHACEQQRTRLNLKQSVYLALFKLGELLEMRERPVLVECYDVAVWQGRSPTASQIVFYNGLPLKKSYRHYHLKMRPEGNNDFAMMEEVLTRRLKKGNLPDVFIVDGGRGQVNTFLTVLREQKKSIPVAGIAKAKWGGTEKQVVDRLIIPQRKNAYVLSKNQALFRLMVHMRDEAHRFSRKLHHKALHDFQFKGGLEMVPGVGPKTKKKILSRLENNLSELKDMDENKLQDILGVDSLLAERIRDYIKKYH